MSAEERAASAALAARGAHTPLTLARRIAKAWPALSAPERAAVIEVLAPLLGDPGCE